MKLLNFTHFFFQCLVFTFNLSKVDNREGFYLRGGLSFSLFFVDRADGRLRYSNSDVTDTEDLVFTPILDRGDIRVTLRGILKLQCF